jgi:hypothetical protein
LKEPGREDEGTGVHGDLHRYAVAPLLGGTLPSPELDQLMSQLSPEPGVPKVVELGTLPGVQYDNVKLENPANGKSQLVFLFDQRTEYLLNCQSTPPERAAIDGACERALATLQKK